MFVSVFQIRVVQAFRMGLDARYDSHSMSSIHSYHSLQNLRMNKKAAASSNPPPTVESFSLGETATNSGPGVEMTKI